MKKAAKILLFVLILLVGLALAVAVFWDRLPYQALAGRQIRAWAAARGVDITALTVERLERTQARFSGVQAGSERPLKVGALEVHYGLEGVQSVLAEDVEATLYRQGGAWRVGGLEALMGNQKTAGAPMPEVELRHITLHMEDKLLHVTAAGLKDGMLHAEGLVMPWGGGTVGTVEISAPLTLDRAVRVVLELKQVELAELLQQTTGGKVAATGKISGRVPVVWHPGGQITLENGQATALGEGTLAVSPEALAGMQEAAVKEVSAALQNFHYRTLRMQFSSHGGKTVLRLSVEGNSPDAFQARPIKLNVNLSGDLIPLVEQTLQPIARPEMLMK